MMIFFLFLMALIDMSIVYWKKNTESERQKDSDHPAIEAFFTIITTNEIHR